MKLTVSILALIVLFLSTQCVFMHENTEPGRSCAKETCCAVKKTCSKNKEKKNNEDCNGICNPFMGCSGCAYIHTEKLLFSLPALMNLSVKAGKKQAVFISSYISDCWHPPRNC